MGRYVEKNLYKDELIVERIRRSRWQHCAGKLWICAFILLFGISMLALAFLREATNLPQKESWLKIMEYVTCGLFYVVFGFYFIEWLVELKRRKRHKQKVMDSFRKEQQIHPEFLRLPRLQAQAKNLKNAKRFKYRRNEWRVWVEFLWTISFLVMSACLVLLFVVKLFGTPIENLKLSGILFVVLALLNIVWIEICFKSTEFVITTKRFIKKKGILFNVFSMDIPFSHIADVHVDRTLWGDVFNSNYICISTTLGKKIEDDWVKDVDKLKTRILYQIDQYEEERFARQARWTADATVRAQERERLLREAQTKPVKTTTRKK